jgi:hypothetical protein
MGDRRVQSDQRPASRAAAGNWISRIGLIGLLFFFFKGLAWITVGALVWLGSQT